MTIQTIQALISQSFIETIKIVLIVAALMIFIEWLEIRFKPKINRLITKNKKNQIIGSSFLGAIPGCIDAFFIVDLYTHGLVGFGALTAVMLSTAGDEAFVMLTMIPKTAFLIFALSIVIGIIGGFIADKLSKEIGRSKPCCIEIHKKKEKKEKKLSLKHFLKEHVLKHVIKKHIPKLFLWIFFTLIAVQFLMQRFDLASILPKNIILLIFIAALIGIIPESGPHLIFLTLFVKGLVPFSVLLTSSLVQDGHGLLPLLSYSVKDTIKVKAFNLVIGLAFGLLFFFLGF